MSGSEKNNSLAFANSAMRMGDFRSALTLYEDLIHQGHSQSAQISLNMTICRKRLEQQKENIPAEKPIPLKAPPPAAQSELKATAIPDDAVPKAKLTVSLTTIDSRLSHLHRVIESLHKQVGRQHGPLPQDRAIFARAL